MPDNCSNSTTVDFTTTSEDPDVSMGNYDTCGSHLATGSSNSEPRAKAVEVCYGMVTSRP